MIVCDGKALGRELELPVVDEEVTAGDDDVVTGAIYIGPRNDIDGLADDAGVGVRPARANICASGSLIATGEQIARGTDLKEHTAYRPQ